MVSFLSASANCSSGALRPQRGGAATADAGEIRLSSNDRDVMRAFLIEYGLLGLAAALLAAVIGTLAAWLVLTRVMHAPWSFEPGAVLGTLVAATLFTLLVGFAGTWRALGAKAAPYLRNE